MIIDDFGMQSLDQTLRMMLMEIIEDRHQEKSTIIASQIPVEKWHEIIGESTIADVSLNSRRVHLKMLDNFYVSKSKIFFIWGR